MAKVKEQLKIGVVVLGGRGTSLLEAVMIPMEDISIIGIDDMPMCELMDPPLTTMHVPKHQMGVQAVKRLLEKINSNSREILTIEIRTSLVERQSIRTVKG